MPKNLKIAFTGTHSTGKTTLVDYLAQHPSFKNFTVHKTIGRGLEAKGFKINEGGNDETQLYILADNLRCDFEKGMDILSDRCLIDWYVYTRYLAQNDPTAKVSQWLVDVGYLLAVECLSQYDYIFFFPPIIPLKDDGVRSQNAEFRDKVHFLFNQFLFTQRGTVTNLHVIPTPEFDQRVQFVLDTIKIS